MEQSRFISSVKHRTPINNPLNILKPRFENPEVSLLAISCLFGLLGASVAGITSLYKQKLWDSTSELNKRRIYLYVVARIPTWQDVIVNVLLKTDNSIVISARKTIRIV